MALKSPDDDYRLTSAVEIDELLQRLHDERALVTLTTPQGQHCVTMMRGLDRGRGIVLLEAPKDRLTLTQAQTSGEIQAVAYLDSIKLQFDVDAPMLVQDGNDAVLHASVPQVLYRFQRRTAYRVRPFVAQSPCATFLPSGNPEGQLSLRILDISLTGAGLLWLSDNPPPELVAGACLEHCLLRLDDSTELETTLRIHHITPLAPKGQGWRLGCEFVRLGADEWQLQNYINQTQKRQLALANPRT